jgi:serine/threonine protein kinase
MCIYKRIIVYISSVETYADDCIIGLQREETEDRDGNDKKPCLDQYQLIACLGQGAYGVVMLAKRKSAVGPGSRQELFAIKSVRKCRNASEYRSIPEKDVLMRAIGHPFLVQMHSCFQTQVRCSFLNVYVFRQLLILKFTVSLSS